MNTRTGVRLAAMVVVLALSLAIGAWLLVPASTAGQPESDTAQTPLRARVSATRSDRSASHARIAVPASRTSSRRESPTDVFELLGRVIDAEQLPIAGALVTIGQSYDASPAVRFGDEADFVVLAEHRTDPRGEFTIDLPRAHPFAIRVSAAGFASQALPKCYGGQERTIVLRPGATLRGRVVSRADGSPIGGASLRASDLDGELCRGTSASDGTFCFPGLRGCLGSLEVVPSGSVFGVTQTVRLAAGETREIEMVVEAGAPVHGRVIDAETGTPIVGAEIGAGSRSRSTVRSDARGEYRIEGCPASDEQLQVTAVGFAPQARRMTLAAGRRIDFALERGGNASGRVISSDNVPLRDVRVTAIGARIDRDASAPDPRRFEHRVTRTRADGTFELADLRVDMRYELHLQVRGRATFLREFPGEVVKGTRIELGDIALGAPSVIEGRVVDAHGEPLEHELVRLDRASEAASILGSPLARVVSTDSRGWFGFADLAPGDYALAIGNDTVAMDMVRLTASVSGGEVVRLGETILDRGLSIRGRVVTPGGLAVPNVLVEARREDSQHAESSITGTDGVFLIRNLTAGRHELRTTAGLTQAWSDVVMRGIDAGTRELRITLAPAAVVLGTLLDGHDKPLASWCVGAIYRFPPSEPSGPFAITDTAGRFELKVMLESVVDLAVAASLERLRTERNVLRHEVRAGARDVVLKLQ